ncbi:MAG: TIGR03620 family F420-dependent LLM class oxidoreductase [Gammaproteobacteria bacterium]
MSSENRIPRGVLAMTDRLSGKELVAFAQHLETSGYDSLWLPEIFGREPMASAAHLLARTERILIASGIANIYARDPHAMVQARYTIAEFSGGRFVLGLGVSNVGLNAARGHAWQAPVTKLNSYLDAMDAVQPDCSGGEHLGPVIIAAHGPLLQRIAAARSNGIMTYLMSPEHTQHSRERVGPNAELNVVVPLLAEADPATAREICRSALGYYLGLDYYHREWRKIGLEDADFADGGSDRLIDKIVAWGNPDVLRERITAFEAAGASRIIVLPLDTATGNPCASATLQALAPGN